MDRAFVLSEEICALRDDFRAFKISLDSLVYRCESLLENSVSELEASRFERAMNSVYILGEINAVALDEGRDINLEERDAVNREIANLVRMTSGTPKRPPN